MPQLFHPVTNVVARVSLFGGAALLGLVGWAVGTVTRSPYVTHARVIRAQPVPFSHRHHVGGLGIDCRYCHTAVEEGPIAGLPSTRICMHCHTQIWADSPMLEPVRESYRTGTPIAWTRVHNLADFAYFDHSIHVAKGIGCATCHGRVDDMPLMWKEATLFMEWCLECHREPELFVRPRDEVFRMDYADRRQAETGPRLVKEYGIEKRTDCSTCHR